MIPAGAADFEKGKQAVNNALPAGGSHPDWKIALRELTPLAEFGHAGAKYFLSFVYVYAYDFVEIDVGRAHRLTHEAAEDGYLQAQVQLGVAYERGFIGEPDFSKAIYWYERAAVGGSSLAADRLAQAYTNGELGVEANPELAKKWLDVRGECCD